MYQLKRIDQELTDIEKPNLSPVNEIVLGQGDIFITCAGFEDRAIEGLKKLKGIEPSKNEVIIIQYLPHIEENRLKEFEELCADKGLLKSLITYDRVNPEGFGFEIREILEKVADRVFIDISGMSRILLIQLLVSLSQFKGSFNGITIIYSEAQNYPPEENAVTKAIGESEDDLWETKSFISSGVFGVSIIPELSSFAMMGKPIRLIIFPSFDPLQLIALRNELQPTFYSFIHGIPHLDKDQWRNQAIKRLNHVSKFKDKDEYEVRTISYKETLDVLLKIYEKSNFLEKILVAPIGSKMQALAVGIMRSYLDDIQIVYPTPKSFESPKKYTEGVRETYSLPLDSFPEIPTSN